MATAFNYRPKYVDVRVNKPDSEERPRAPDERACDRMGCERAGEHRAPKGRQHEGDYWWFCVEHASEYNRSFNYFEGMSPEELTEYAQSEVVGHRPTWSFKVGSRDRLAASMRDFQSGRRKDPFNLFGAGAGEAPRESRKPKLGRLHALALEVLGMEEGAAPEAIRERYADLVKRFHPDSNGGDRSTEAQLHKTIRAFQTLRAAGLA